MSRWESAALLSQKQVSFFSSQLFKYFQQFKFEMCGFKNIVESDLKRWAYPIWTVENIGLDSTKEALRSKIKRELISAFNFRSIIKNKDLFWSPRPYSSIRPYNLWRLKRVWFFLGCFRLNSDCFRSHWWIFVEYYFLYINSDALLFDRLIVLD